MKNIKNVTYVKFYGTTEKGLESGPLTNYETWTEIFKTEKSLINKVKEYKLTHIQTRTYTLFDGSKEFHLTCLKKQWKAGKELSKVKNLLKRMNKK